MSRNKSLAVPLFFFRLSFLTVYNQLLICYVIDFTNESQQMQSQPQSKRSLEMKFVHILDYVLFDYDFSTRLLFIRISSTVIRSLSKVPRTCQLAQSGYPGLVKHPRWLLCSKHPSSLFWKSLTALNSFLGKQLFNTVRGSWKYPRQVEYVSFFLSRGTYTR